MPEGPSIFILKELIKPLFTQKKIIRAFGNSKIEMALLPGKKVIKIRSWGKQLLIYIEGVTIRIHLLMFGSFSINEITRPERNLRLALEFAEGSIYFYSCSVRLLPGSADKLYDWQADVLSDKWDPLKARKKLKDLPKTMVCDALLDQQIFSGVGNIIKNEVLYRNY